MLLRPGPFSLRQWHLAIQKLAASQGPAQTDGNDTGSRQHIHLQGWLRMWARNGA